MTHDRAVAIFHRIGWACEDPDAPVPPYPDSRWTSVERRLWAASALARAPRDLAAQISAEIEHTDEAIRIGAERLAAINPVVNAIH